MLENLRLARISRLINYAVRVRSTHYIKNSPMYSEILEELKRSMDPLQKTEELPPPDVPAEENLENPPCREEPPSNDDLKELKSERQSRVLKRYEKTFGKSKLASFIPKPSQNRERDPVLPSKQRTIFKLRQLEEREKVIKERKEELNNWLLTHKSSSRKTTVGSLIETSRPRTQSAPKKPGNFLTPIMESHRKIHRPMSHDEVGDLIRSFIKDFN